MDERIKKLLDDLELYIQENWLAPGDEQSCEKPAESGESLPPGRIADRERDRPSDGPADDEDILLSDGPADDEDDGLSDILADDEDILLSDDPPDDEDDGLSDILADDEDILLSDDQADDEDDLFDADICDLFGPDDEDFDVEDIFSKGSSVFAEKKSSFSLEDLLGEVGDTFHEVLFEKIARSGMTDVEVYKRANMDRKLFSKIRTNPAYHPKKGTVLALAIALKLNLEETQDLLSRAEYALSPSSKSDVIIRYFIEHREYDIHLINIALDEHGQEILD